MLTIPNPNPKAYKIPVELPPNAFLCTTPMMTRNSIMALPNPIRYWLVEYNRSTFACRVNNVQAKTHTYAYFVWSSVEHTKIQIMSKISKYAWHFFFCHIPSTIICALLVPLSPSLEVTQIRGHKAGSSPGYPLLQHAPSFLIARGIQYILPFFVCELTRTVRSCILLATFPTRRY